MMPAADTALPLFPAPCARLELVNNYYPTHSLLQADKLPEEISSPLYQHESVNVH